MITPGSLEDDQKLLFEQLYKLNPVGEHGFEGFMAKALSELTGLAFYVAKSGHQDGSDVRSAPHNLFKIGLEGKRYMPSTSLPLDELLHKIIDASTAQVPVDLWLLATTRRVDVSDREKLHEHGENVGIGVIVLDRPNNLKQLCELTVICASAPNTCRTFLNSKLLSKALDLIREDTEFEGIRSQILDRLKQADTGYVSARLASEHWMVEAQESLNNAKSRLGGHHDLLKSDYGVISRTAINGQLDEWYASGHSVAALIGDEGTGKSWALLDWFNALKSFETGAPLTVFLKAKTIDTSDVKSAIANALAAQTRISSVAFWKKRLALWERSGGGVEILILVDGLNENFKFTEWADWLQPLFESNLGGMYRVILSCWQNWWKESLAGLANLTPEPKIIDVDRFNDSELDALLAAMDAKHSDFASAVLELMRVPRLSALVAKYREKLQKSGDVTAERVIYEDWKDRLKRHGTKTGLTDPEMKAFVADLGKKLKKDIDQAVTRKDIIESLSEESGKGSLELQLAVIELTSGAWLKSGDNPNTFRVATDRIPFVLGATLMSEIREETQVTVIEAMIAEFLDPLKAHSLGAAILRAATTIALIESDTSPEIRKTLLSMWLDEQNFRDSDFEAFWRLAGLDSDLFFNLAEALWLSGSGGSLVDEVLIKTFANAGEFHDFENNLKERLTKWLSTAWPDPRVGAVLGKVDRTRQDSMQRAAKTRTNHTEWVSGETAKSFTSVTVDDNDGWSWLSHRALAILSYLKRAPFVCVLEAWALSRSIMQIARHQKEVAWILRLNSVDASETSEEIGGVIERLKGKKNRICDQAAVYLEGAMSNVERAGTALTLDRDSPEVVSPSDVTGMDANALVEAAQNYLLPNGWKRYEPESTAAVMNALIERGIDENEGALGFIVHNLHDLLIALTPDSRLRLREAITAELEAFKDDCEEGKTNTAKLELARLLIQFYDAESTEQSALVLSFGLGTSLDPWLPFCRSITLQDLAGIDLKSAPVDHVAGWLDYIDECLPKEEIAKLKFLPDLITRDEQNVRYKALVLATHGRNLPAIKAFAASPYSKSASGEDKPKLEYEYWRNLALLEFCEFTPDASMSECLSPEYIALVVNQRPTDSQALGQFNEYLQGEFEAIRTEQPWSRPRYWDSHKKAIFALVEHNLEAVLKWLEPWLKNPGNRVHYGLMNHFPVIDTMQALSVKAPEISLKLYKLLTDRSDSVFFSSDGIVNFPFEVPDSQCADNLCEKLFEEAKTDELLLEIAFLAYRNNRLDWLFNQISCLERSEKPVDVAKAYTLLGFCDECGRADAMWQAFLKRPPKDLWLDSVIRSSADDYEKNRAARLVLSDFWSSKKMWAAQHALKRLVGMCDLRIWLWFQGNCPNRDNRPYRHRVAFDLATASLNQAIKKDKESRKKKLFHTRIPLTTMAPWK